MKKMKRLKNLMKLIDRLAEFEARLLDKWVLPDISVADCALVRGLIRLGIVEDAR